MKTKLSTLLLLASFSVAATEFETPLEVFSEGFDQICINLNGTKISDNLCTTPTGSFSFSLAIIDDIIECAERIRSVNQFGNCAVFVETTVEDNLVRKLVPALSKAGVTLVIVSVKDNR